MKEQLDQFKAGMRVLAAFVDNYSFSLVLPENMAQISLSCNCPALTIYADWAPNEDGRQRVLSVVGESLGRDGWTRKAERYSSIFNWHKKLDGVSITINGAQKMPEEGETPVYPNEFPIMLANSAPIEVEDEVVF